MLALLSALVGFAFVDSLNVLVLVVTAAIVYDSRLGRRSPLPGGLSFIAGVYAATTSFGICVVLGLNFLTDLVDVDLTPPIRYGGQLALGLVLIGLATIPIRRRKAAAPLWATTVMRQRPWLLGLVGAVVGFGQACTSVPYLSALAMIAARSPLPRLW